MQPGMNSTGRDDNVLRPGHHAIRVDCVALPSRAPVSNACARVRRRGDTGPWPPPPYARRAARSVRRRTVGAAGVRPAAAAVVWLNAQTETTPIGDRVRGPGMADTVRIASLLERALGCPP